MITLARRLVARPFVLAVSATFATKIVGILVGVISLTFTTRLLGPEGRGQFSVVMGVVAVVLQCANFGLHASGIYYLSREPGLRREMAGLLLAFSTLGVGLVAACAYAAVRLYPWLLPAIPLDLVRIALLVTPPAMFVLLAGSALLGLGAPSWYNGLDLAIRLIGLVAVAMLLRGSLESLFWTYAGLHWVVAGVAYLRLAGARRPGWPTASQVQGLFGYGGRAFLASLLMFVVLRLDLFLVNALLGTAEAGRYSVATQVGEILLLAAASIGVILFPRLSVMDEGARRTATWRVAGATGLVLGLGAAGLALGSRPVFLAWFGPEFSPAADALWWLLPGLWCLGVNTVLAQYLAASGMPWFVVGAALGGAIANLLLNLRLIPAFGIVGAAAASSLSYAGLLVVSLWYLRPGKRGKGTPRA